MNLRRQKKRLVKDKLVVLTWCVCRVDEATIFFLLSNASRDILPDTDDADDVAVHVAAGRCVQQNLQPTAVLRTNGKAKFESSSPRKALLSTS